MSTKCALQTLVWPEGFAEKYDLGDLVRDDVSVAEFTGQHCVPVRTARTASLKMVRADLIKREKLEWLMPGHLQLGTFVSLSGRMGTQKSLIAKFFAAKTTAGRPFPGCKLATIPPSGVLYFTSEDSATNICDLVEIAGGDLTKLFVHDIASGEEVIDILEMLPEIKAEINAHGVKLVIIDALNSFVGGDISSDAKARRTLSGKLQALARQTGACIIGVRNWGRSNEGTASQMALGATSLSDVARCVLNTRETSKTGDLLRTYQLEFEKVSGAQQPKPIPYTVKDLSRGDPSKSHHRRLVWETPLSPEFIESWKNYIAKKVTQKGNAGTSTRRGEKEVIAK